MSTSTVTLSDYERFVGPETIERIVNKAKPLRGRTITHMNATYYGGGVAELLTSLVPLMNSIDLKAEWRVLRGNPQFFDVTKAMHNALQGGDFDFSALDTDLYEQVNAENAARTHLDAQDFVVMHDPQVLPMVTHYTKRCPWIWRGHIDFSAPNADLWNYLLPFIERYDAVVLSIPEFAQEITPPEVFIMPAIDPFSVKNRSLDDATIDERLAHYNIPTDLPLVVQVSRFDPWKDPLGVIEAYKQARKEVNCTLVLLGNFAADDPEGKQIYEQLEASREERIMILPYGDDIDLVNALQTRAAVVLQKSTREGFGLTVTEALWKGTPVIGGNVGGIRYQIEDGVNGYLVSSIDETAQRLVRLLKDDRLRDEMGTKARETVRDKFLTTRYLEQYLDLFNGFEMTYTLRQQ